MPRPLSPAQHRTIAALAEAIAPPGAGLPADARQARVADQLERLVERFDPTSRRALKLLASALHVAPLTAGCATTFPRLSRARREAYLHRALSGRRWDRDIALTLRALCEMLYCGDRRFREHVGDRNEPYRQGLPVPPETPLPVVCHPELRASTSLDCDVVVVGSGAGGATVALELAREGPDVVVVEEGGPVSREDFAGHALHRVVKYYRQNGLTSAIGDSLIPVPMGRVVGGTTVVNSGTCLRAPDSLLADWVREHGLELAAPEALGPQYDALAEQLEIEPVGDDIMGNNGRIVRRGAEALGLRWQPIPRPARGCAGTGQCGFGCPRDAKRAMHLTFLPEAARHGTRIYAGCRVERVLTSDGRARGVRASVLDAAGRPTGHTLTVRAAAVFLCAGALLTPVLLRRSGLGRSSRALGRHLRIHPGSGITGRFDEVVRGWQGVMQSLAIDEKLDEGFLLEATFPPLGMSYSAASLPGIGDEHARLLGQYAQMASIGSIVSDTASGSVREVPGLGPSMFYRVNAEDARRAVEAISLAARVLFAAGAREVYPGIPSLPILRSAAEADALRSRRLAPRNLKLSAYHPMGTARMGRDPARSVCDPSARVHGSANLFVADTSLFPGSPHVNPQLTLMALCRGLAQRFLDGWPGRRRPFPRANPGGATR